MNPPQKYLPPIRRLAEKQDRMEGAALIIVLAFLVILTGLTVAFLSSVTEEATSTSAAASAVTTRSLADATTQIVIGQIRDATAGFDHDASGVMNTGSPLCWASQPGAIRTFGTAAQAVATYKLYSSTNMVDRSGNAPSGDLPPDNSWTNKQALYTDLNAPVTVQTSTDTNTNYPIMDPVMTNVASTAVGSTNIIDGFSISNAPTIQGCANPAAMPVVWLYMLKDGTLLAPDGTSATKATFNNDPNNGKLTASNPIVGRVAFWTDDESCKLNINTASEGSYWGIPSFSASQDVAFSLYPPSASEFNRYPGHPASTCLSPVLWSFLGLGHPMRFVSGLPSNTSNYDAAGGTNTPSMTAANTTYFTNLFTNVTPRYGWGGSQAGTASSVQGVQVNPAGVVTLNANRLYSSIDEFFFSAATRATNPTGGFQAGDVSRLRFFVTAASRAPEVNPLNMPKLCMWPLPATNNAMKANPNSVAGSTRTITDETIAYCSTIGNYPYYFSRYDATSTANDYNNLPRNQTLYSYLRTQLDQKMPGFNGSFTAGKWSSKQTDQITTLIFDYIRSCINLVDTTGMTVANALTFKFTNSYTVPPSVPSVQSMTLNTGTGQVVPITIGSSRGIGRFPTIRGGDFWIIARAANQPPIMCHPDGRPIVYDSAGTQISTWFTNGSYIDFSNTNLFAGGMTAFEIVLRGKAHAVVNPLHPWTCPPTSTNIPQYTNAAGQAYLSDTSANATKYATNPATNYQSVYPIFDLFTGQTNLAGTSQVRIYPSYNGSSNLITYSAGITETWYTKAPPIVANKLYGGIQTVVVANNTAGNNSTHPGLPFLTIQDTTTGAFTISNTKYKDIALNPGETRMEVAYIPDFVNVAPGSIGMEPNLSLTVSGLNGLSFVGGFSPPTGTPSLIFTNYTSLTLQNWYNYDLGIQFALASRAGSGGVSCFTLYSTATHRATGNTFPFVGGTLTHTISSSGSTVQTVSINFPSATFPTPKLPTSYFNFGGFSNNYPPISPADFPTNAILTFQTNTTLGNGNNTRFSVNVNWRDLQQYGLIPTEMGAGYSATDPSYPAMQAGMNYITADTIQGVNLQFSDPRVIACLPSVPSSMFVKHPLYGYTTQVNVGGIWPTYIRNAHDMRSGNQAMNGGYYGTLNATSQGAGWTNNYKYPPMAQSSSPSILLMGGITGLTGFNTNFFGWQFFRSAGGYMSVNNGYGIIPYTGADCDFTKGVISPATVSFLDMWKLGGDFDNGIGFQPDGPFINKADEGFGAKNGFGNVGSNPYFSLVSSSLGLSMFSANRMVPSPIMFGSLPVFDSTWDPANPTVNSSWRTLQFSPNPNALDTTLATARSTAAGYSPAGKLITSTTPPDHLLLDFFEMPVVDPYPISDPFSTAGKVNMNYQIAPFSYIHRDTALRGVLKPVMITAVDDQWSFDYKLRTIGNGYADNGSSRFDDPITRVGTLSYNAFGTASKNFYFHYPIHIPNTLQQFDQRFALNDLFHSPSEICALWLYPANQPDGNLAESKPLSMDVNGSALAWDPSSLTSIQNWWYGNPGTTRKGITGDNLRERPYNYIYPRLTTKSNTFQIHYRVQLLKQTTLAHGNGNFTTWVDPSGTGATDKVLGEQRGSAMIERYIDPGDPRLPDFAGDVQSKGASAFTDPSDNIDTYYKFRIFSTKQFNP